MTGNQSGVMSVMRTVTCDQPRLQGQEYTPCTSSQSIYIGYDGLFRGFKLHDFKSFAILEDILFANVPHLNCDIENG